MSKEPKWANGLATEIRGPDGFLTEESANAYAAGIAAIVEGRRKVAEPMDLVDELRASGGDDPICLVAADVIERLRVELEGAKADIAMLIAAEVAVENGE